MHQEPLAHDRSFHAAAIPGLRSTPLSLTAGRILFILNCKDCTVELRTCLLCSLVCACCMQKGPLCELRGRAPRPTREGLGFIGFRFGV